MEAPCLDMPTSITFSEHPTVHGFIYLSIQKNVVNNQIPASVFIVFYFITFFLFLIIHLNCNQHRIRRSFVKQIKEISTQVTQYNIQKEQRVCYEVPLSLQLSRNIFKCLNTLPIPKTYVWLQFWRRFQIELFLKKANC